MKIMNCQLLFVLVSWCNMVEAFTEQDLEWACNQASMGGRSFFADGTCSVRFVTTSKTYYWPAGRFCKTSFAFPLSDQINGRLAIPYNWTSWVNVRNSLLTVTNETVFVGLRQTPDENWQWHSTLTGKYWMSGAVYGEINWKDDQPDDSNGFDQRFGAVKSSNRLHDTHNNARPTFICEYRLNCSHSPCLPNQICEPVDHPRLYDCYEVDTVPETSHTFEYTESSFLSIKYSVNNLKQRHVIRSKGEYQVKVELITKCAIDSDLDNIIEGCGKILYDYVSKMSEEYAAMNAKCNLDDITDPKNFCESEMLQVKDNTECVNDEQTWLFYEGEETIVLDWCTDPGKTLNPFKVKIIYSPIDYSVVEGSCKIQQLTEANQVLSSVNQSQVNNNASDGDIIHVVCENGYKWSDAETSSELHRIKICSLGDWINEPTTTATGRSCVTECSSCPVGWESTAGLQSCLRINTNRKYWEDHKDDWDWELPDAHLFHSKNKQQNDIAKSEQKLGCVARGGDVWQRVKAIRPQWPGGGTPMVHINYCRIPGL